MEKVIEEILHVLGEDKDKIKEFISNPKETLEKHNIDFNPEHLKDIVEAVKAKVNVEDLLEKGEELLDGIKGFFKK